MRKVFMAMAVAYIVFGLIVRYTLPAYSANSCPLSCGDQDKSMSVEDAVTAMQIMRLKGPAGTGAVFTREFSATSSYFATSNTLSALVYTGSAYIYGIDLVDGTASGTLILYDGTATGTAWVSWGTGAMASRTVPIVFNPPFPVGTGIFLSAANVGRWNIYYSTK